MRLDALPTVKLSPVNLAISPPGIPLAVSDATGSVPASSLQSGPVLGAFHQGFEPRLFTAHESPAPHIVQLERAGGPRLECQTTDGRRLTGARVLIEAGQWGWPIPNARGKFFDLGNLDAHGSILLPRALDRPLQLLVLHEMTTPWRISESFATQRIPLSAALKGRVIGHISYGDLQVAAIPTNSSNLCPQLVEVANDGTFTFESLAEGLEWELTPCQGNAWAARSVGPTVTVRLPMDGVQLELSRGAEVRVRAIARSTGAVLAPRILISRLPEEVLADERSPHAVNSADGAWTWSDLAVPPDCQQVWVDSPGFAPQSVSWSPAKPGIPIDLGQFELAPFAGANFRVVDAAAGFGIEGAWVNILPGAASAEEPWMVSGETDTRGKVSLSLPSAGDLQIMVRKQGWLPLDGRYSSDSGQDEQLIELQQAAVIEVSCVTQFGDPLPHQAIAWRALGSSPWKTEFSARDGTITLEVRPGDVEVRQAPEVVRGLSGSAQIQITTDPPASLDPILIQALQSGEHRKVELQVATINTQQIRVLVNGMPVEGLRVLGLNSGPVNPTGTDLFGTLDAPKGLTDSNGLVALKGLHPGALYLMIQSPSGLSIWTRSFQIATDSGLITIHLPSRAVTVRVLDREGSPLAGVAVRARPVLQEGVRLPIVLARQPLGIPEVAAVAERGALRRTDAQGEIVFSQASTESVLLIECAHQEAYPTIAKLSLAPSTAPASVELAEATAGSIEVLILDQAGSRRPRVPIRVSGPGWARIEISGEDGAIHLAGLGPGDWHFKSPSLEAPSVISLIAGESRVLSVRLSN